ncbi:unnamed protein product [Linum trigynum]|uniref:Uncharacterized protein n=1 Tax=Linum trigynum TaxID=586398 RepID=A0AAV2CFI2_9ROSI
MILVIMLNRNWLWRWAVAIKRLPTPPTNHLTPRHSSSLSPLSDGEDCGGCFSPSSADSGGGWGSWGSRLIRRSPKKSSPPSMRTLDLGRRPGGGCGSSSEIVGDVFYGTDDAEGIEDYKYKEDLLEHYRRESERKSVRRRKRKMRRSWFGAIVDCFSFLKFFCCLR